jgi:hypothetical protein
VTALINVTKNGTGTAFVGTVQIGNPLATGINQPTNKQTNKQSNQAKQPTNQPTNQPTKQPAVRSRILFPSKKFPAFYGTRKFIAKLLR